MTVDTYKIRLPSFEGPLDLLLHLIKKNEIDIYDIPIALITRQYLEYLELMKELNLEIAGEFLVMAATLIQIKTRMLLPVDEQEAGHDEDDPRMELVERLLEYQAIKTAAAELYDRMKMWSSSYFSRTDSAEPVQEQSTLSLFDVNVFDLLMAFKKVLQKAPVEQVMITREILTVREKMGYIVQFCSEGICRFEDIFSNCKTKAEIIVTFLALLELIRLGVLKVRQQSPEGQIWILYNKSEETKNKNSGGS